MNVNNTRIQQYVAYWKSAQSNVFTELGITETGTPEFGAKGSYVNLEDADQFFGRIASQLVGHEVMCRIVLKEVSYAELYSRLLQGQLYQVIDGVRRRYDADTVPVNMNRDIAGELRLVPLSAPPGDLSECITIWKAAPQLDLKLAGDRTKYQTVAAEFMAYPDSLRARPGYPLSAGYYGLGDPNALPSDPDFIGASFGDQPMAPYKHTPAFSIAPGDKKKTFWYGAWTADGTQTALINNGGGYSATATSLIYDTKSPLEDFTGKYIRINSEILYVTADSNPTGSAGTLTVVRGALFSTPATIADNDTITVQNPDSIAILPVTGRAIFASSAPAVATVGDSASTGSLPFGDKGLVTHVSAGTTNITATIGTTVSQALVTTAT
jgi:hypothetical protein